MRKLGHTSVKKGKKVMLIFANGSKLITKFIERKGHFVVTEDGKWRIGDVL